MKTSIILDDGKVLYSLKGSWLDRKVTCLAAWCLLQVLPWQIPVIHVGHPSQMDLQRVFKADYSPL